GGEQDHAVLDALHQEVIEAHLAELVDHHRRVGECGILEQAVEQRGLAGAEEAGEHVQRDGCRRPSATRPAIIHCSGAAGLGWGFGFGWAAASGSAADFAAGGLAGFAAAGLSAAAGVCGLLATAGRAAGLAAGLSPSGLASGLMAAALGFGAGLAGF